VNLEGIGVRRNRVGGCWLAVGPVGEVEREENLGVKPFFVVVQPE